MRRRRCSTASRTPSALADFLAANLPIEQDDIAEKQRMLEETGRGEAPADHRRAAGDATRRAGTAKQDPVAGEGKHRQEPAAVLPAGTAQGDPQGTGRWRLGGRRQRNGNAARATGSGQASRSRHEGGHPRTQPAGFHPQRQPGIRRHPDVPADPQRIALVGDDRRTRSIWRRRGKSSTATITIWTR